MECMYICSSTELTKYNLEVPVIYLNTPIFCYCKLPLHYILGANTVLFTHWSI